jgi:hypothetical protein
MFLTFEHSDFEFVSNFVIRISDFRREVPTSCEKSHEIFGALYHDSQKKIWTG